MSTWRVDRARRQPFARRCAADRAALAVAAEPIRRKLSTLDGALAVVRAHPFIAGVAAGAAAFAARRPLLGLARRTLAAYAAMRRL